MPWRSKIRRSDDRRFPLCVSVAHCWHHDDANSALLIRIKEIFDRRNAEFLTSTALVSELNKDPSAWWYRTSEQKLARFLRAFHLRPEQHRLGRGGTGGGGRGYWRSQLEQRA